MGKVGTVRISQDEVLIEIKGICKTYVMDDEVVHASDYLDLTIRVSESIVTVGKSGSGKSTLMNIIDAPDASTSGTCLLGGEDVGDMTQNEFTGIRNHMIGSILQQYNFLLRLNLLENMGLPLLYAHIPGSERKERALRQLEKVGLKEKAKDMPSQLSGGQQQHVSIARALAGNPSFLLADEPTSALDSRTSHQIFDFFQELHKEGNIIIMIMHSNSIAVRAKHVVQTWDGKINFGGKAEGYAAITQACVKEHLEQ